MIMEAMANKLLAPIKERNVTYFRRRFYCTQQSFSQLKTVCDQRNNFFKGKLVQDN